MAKTLIVKQLMFLIFKCLLLKACSVFSNNLKCCFIICRVVFLSLFPV